MALVRTLYFCAACFDIHVMVTHIAGTTNVIADAIFHLQIGRFKQLAPNTPDLQTPSLHGPPSFGQIACSYQSLGVAPSTRRTYKLGSVHICYFVTNSPYHPSQLPHLPYATSAHTLLVMCLTRQSRCIYQV